MCWIGTLTFSCRNFGRLLLAVLVLCLLVAPVRGAGEPKTATVLVSALNLRSGPGRHNPPIATLRKGDRVLVVSYEGEWVRVLSEDRMGFVLNRASYLRIEAPAEVTVAGETPPEAPDDPSDRIQAELELSLEQVASTIEAERAIISALEENEKALDRARKEVLRISSEREALELRIREHENRLREIERRAEINEPYVAGRLSALYKLSWLGTFNFLASADSMFDFFANRRSLELILADDALVMKQLYQDKADVEVMIAQLAELRDEKRSASSVLSGRIQAKAAQQAHRDALLTEVRGKKSLQLAAIEALKESARALDQTVADFQAASPLSTPSQPAAAEKPFSALKGLLMMPVKGKIVSRFGPPTDRQSNLTRFQNGIAIQADRGEPIRAVYSGQTLFSAWFKGFGNMMIIDHGENYYTVYAHLEEHFKSQGDRVQAGEVIATVGDTGSLTGAGLYFEIRHHGKPINPLHWIKRG